MMTQGDQNGLPELSMDDIGMFDDNVMGNFLFDIMNPIDAESNNDFTQPGILPDVLDFAFEDFLTVNDVFAPPLQQAAVAPSRPVSRPRSPSRAATPSVQRAANLGHQAFKDSAWLWVPNRGDNRHAEQSNLAIRDETLIEAGISPSDSALQLRVSQSSRDRLLSMVLRSCELPVQRHVVSCFPSAASLSYILDSVLSDTPYEIGRWIHVPSLKIDDEREEFLGGLLANAAALSKQNSLQRLGFAIQEATRCAVADRFEEDNRNTRDLRTIQSSALVFHVGFWGGDRRQMEIAESLTYPLITMLRRGGRFKSHAHDANLSSCIDMTTERWNQWLEAEAFKRLAYHLFLQDTAVSMSFFTPPLISYMEMQLVLPCSDALWQAPSVESFNEVLKSLSNQARPNLPTLRDSLKDLGQLSRSEAEIDRHISLDIIVSCFWGRVWQHRQMISTPSLGTDKSPSLAASALYDELVLIYRHMQMQPVDFDNAASCWKVKLELCMLHLHVSLEEIQTFAGKEGEAPARRIVPSLQQWFKSTSSRQALRHAGQVLRAVSQHRKGPLPALSAVAVYHASLTMWAYGILSKHEEVKGYIDDEVQRQRLVIDADQDPHWEPFLLLSRGRPSIQDYGRNETQQSDEDVAQSTIPLERPLEVMMSMIGLLTQKCGEVHTSPPMVGALTKLMLSLGKAAAATRRAYV